MPRLQRFREANPGIVVWVSTRESTGSEGQLDARFLMSEKDPPNTPSWRLMQEYLFPVAVPALLAKLGKPRSPADLCRYPLLLRIGDVGTVHWRQWFDHAGIPAEVWAPALKTGPRFSDSATALQAALEGQGIALVRSSLVWDDLAAGRVVRLFNVYCPFYRAIYLACPKHRVERPALTAFREWLLAESAKCQAEFDAARGGHRPGRSLRRTHWDKNDRGGTS